METFDISKIKLYKTNPYKILQSYDWVHGFMNCEKGSEEYKRYLKELKQADIDHAEWLLDKEYSAG